MSEDHGATVTLAEAAFRLGVSERTLRKRIAAGTLAAEKKPIEGGGSGWQIPVSVLPAASDRDGSAAEAEAESGTEAFARGAEVTTGTSEVGAETKAEGIRKQNGSGSEAKNSQIEAVAGEVHQLRAEIEQLKGALVGGALAQINERLARLDEVPSADDRRAEVAQAVQEGITAALQADAAKEAQAAKVESAQYQKLLDAMAQMSGELAELREDREKKRGFFARLFGG
jgi:chromosome segregation ATPase